MKWETGRQGQGYKKLSLMPQWPMLYDTLAQMHGLRDGWLDPESPAPSVNALGQAKNFLDAATHKGFLPTHINPSVNGGVGITFLATGNSKEVFIEFLNSGAVFSIAMAGRKPTDELNELEFDPTDMGAQIDRIRNYIQNTAKK